MNTQNIENLLEQIEQHLSYNEKISFFLSSIDKKIDNLKIGGIQSDSNKKEIDSFLKTMQKKASFEEREFNILKADQNNILKNITFISKSILSFKESLTSSFIKLSSFLPSQFTFVVTLAEYFEYYTDNLRKATASTVDLNNGFSGLIVAANRAGMTLEEYATFLENYSGVINRYGISSVTRMIDSIRSNANELFQMGFTVSQINNYFGEFLEQQRIFDGNRSRTELELQEMFRNQMNIVFNISKATGRSINDVFTSIKNKLTTPVDMTALQMLPDNIRNEVLKFIEVFPSLSEIMLTGVRTGAIQFSENYTKYATSILPQLESIFSGLTSGAMSSSDAIKILTAAVNSLTDDQKRLFALMGSNVNEAVSGLIFEVNRLNNDLSENLSTNKIDNFSAVLLGLESLFKDFQSDVRTKFLEVFVEDKTPEQINEIFKNFRDTLFESTNNIKNAFISLLETIAPGKSTIEASLDLVALLLNSFADLISWFGKPENIESITKFFQTIKNIAGFFISAESGVDLLKVGIIGILFAFRNKILNFIGFVANAFFIGLLAGIKSLNFGELLIGLREKIKNLFETNIAESLTKSERTKKILETGQNLKGKIPTAVLERGKTGLKGGAIGIGIGLGTELISEAIPEEQKALKEVLGFAGLGASVGATAGSIAPGVGTALGAVVGAGVGTVIGGAKQLYESLFPLEEEIKSGIEKRNEELSNQSNILNENLNLIREELGNISRGINNLNGQVETGNIINSNTMEYNKNISNSIKNMFPLQFSDMGSP